MSSLWEVPAYLIMAFSLALDAPAGKASRDLAQTAPQISNAVNAAVPASPGMPDEIWLRAVKTAAPHSDVLRYYADRIFITSSGKVYVPSDQGRAEIRSLQSNSEVVTRVIAAATRINRKLLIGLGNSPSPGVLLIAHVYGIASAQRFCAALERDGEALAGELLPELAGELQSSPHITVAALEARLTALATGKVVARKSDGGSMRAKERVALSGPLKGTVVQSEQRPDGRVARGR